MMMMGRSAGWSGECCEDRKYGWWQEGRRVNGFQVTTLFSTAETGLDVSKAMTMSKRIKNMQQRMKDKITRYSKDTTEKEPE